jgi:membrane protease YdiL (CAAX protease family)
MILSRWATIGFSVLSLAFGAAIAALAVALMKKPVRLDGTTFAIIVLVSTPVQVATLMMASRRSGFSVLVYLGVDIPRRAHIVITVAGLVVWLVFVETLGLVFGQDTSPWMLKMYHSATGSLIWLWLAVIVASPIGEEILFRGFMFRGFVRAPREALPSIVLISLIWSIGHTQYDWFDVAMIFLFGVLLGFVRWSTGSTTLTILLHMMNNLVSSIEVEFVLS